MFVISPKAIQAFQDAYNSHAEHCEQFSGGSNRTHKRTPIETGAIPEVVSESSSGDQATGDGGSSTEDDGGGDDPDRQRTEIFNPQHIIQLWQVLEPLTADLVQRLLKDHSFTHSGYLSGVAQVSQKFNIPEGTLRKHLKDIRHSRRGKRLYFHSQDVVDWLKQGERTN
jgi:hypothetical protein